MSAYVKFFPQSKDDSHERIVEKTTGISNIHEQEGEGIPAREALSNLVVGLTNTLTTFGRSANSLIPSLEKNSDSSPENKERIDNFKKIVAGLDQTLLFVQDTGQKLAELNDKADTGYIKR